MAKGLEVEDAPIELRHPNHHQRASVRSVEGKGQSAYAFEAFVELPVGFSKVDSLFSFQLSFKFPRTAYEIDCVYPQRLVLDLKPARKGMVEWLDFSTSIFLSAVCTILFATGKEQIGVEIVVFCHLDIIYIFCKKSEHGKLNRNSSLVREPSRTINKNLRRRCLHIAMFLMTVTAKASLRIRMPSSLHLCGSS